MSGNATEAPASRARMGRQPSTTRAELSHIALQLFLEHGFDETTADEIAVAAGIGRRTLFRYFASKNDLPWGDFDAGLEDMRRFLRELPDGTPLLDALSSAVIEFNRFPPEEIPYHRERMDLLLNVPSLVAHSALRYASWRQVVAEYAAKRLGVPEDTMEPQTIAWTYLGTSLSAYEQWLKDEDSDLGVLLAESMRVLERVFGVDGPG